MADVFVSYARLDKARVAPLVAALERRGWSVWGDPDITPGEEFDSQIEAQLQAARAVVPRASTDDPPRSAFGASPPRGRSQRPGGAGSAAAAWLDRFGRRARRCSDMKG